ncbi:MAG: 3-keto-5-aminohexanoate cleavage protein, partial [Oscillospiraceae bacterium]
TVEEYLYRRSMMPNNCKCVVSIMGKEQMDILVAAVRNGDGVRVGTEDYPFTQQGSICEAHDLVKEIADISRSLGREVATPEQAREILGIYD